MIFFRVFWWDGVSKDKESPLFVPAGGQRQGRHDVPDRDLVLYASLEKAAAIAEKIQPFRNRSTTLTDREFCLADDKVMAIAEMEITEPHIINFVDPRNLVKFGLAPADIASSDRERTQKVAQIIYDKGFEGFLWWSTLEATWTNATFFLSRMKKKTKMIKIEPLTISLPEVQEAAQRLNIVLA